MTKVNRERGSFPGLGISGVQAGHIDIGIWTGALLGGDHHRYRITHVEQAAGGLCVAERSLRG